MLVHMGVNRFKFIGHRMVQNVMNAGAIGVEIQISGKVPSKRAKTWKFLLGYLPKCGHPANEYVNKGYRIAELKPGIVGVTVKILPPGAEMPDDIIITGEVREEVIEESRTEEELLEQAEEAKKEEKKAVKKKPAKKKTESKKKKVKKESKK
jgi:small subunit ribosomal protein S3